MKAGDTYAAITFTFRSTYSGTPLDFPPGTIARAQMRDSSSGDLLMSWPVSVNGNVITLAAVTQSPRPGQHRVDVETTTPDGTVLTWIDGALIEVRKDYAHA